jgi:hypothetical protein
MNQEPPEALLFGNSRGSWTVASRNSLYQILAINVALGVWQRAKMWPYLTRIGLGTGECGGDCYRELPRILPFLETV